MLGLAVEYGWEPAGTHVNECFARSMLERPGQDPPDLEAAVAEAVARWDGTYETSDYQVVTDTDAAAMAVAISRAADAVREGERSETDEGFLRAFAAFCRAGSFLIG